MTSNELKNFGTEFENSIKKCCCCCSNIPPLATTGIAIGSVLTTASLFSPKVRKVTIPLFKYATKQQLRLLAGIGVLSIATYMTAPKNKSTY